MKLHLLHFTNQSLIRGLLFDFLRSIYTVRVPRLFLKPSVDVAAALIEIRL
jgi:hypothetical protein